MRLQKTSPVSTLPRWPRCKNVQQQSVRKHMTSRWFCEGIFVNEVIPKLNKTLPGIFNIRVLPDLSLFAVSFTGSWKSCWKFIQTPKSISYLHCVFCWELTRKQPDAQGLRNFTIGKKPPTFGQMRRGGEGLKQLNCCIQMMCQMSGMMKIVDISFWKGSLGSNTKGSLYHFMQFSKAGARCPFLSHPRGFHSMFCEDHRDRKGDRDEWRKFGSPLGWKNGVFCNG